MNASDSEDPPDFDELDIAVAHWHVNAWGGAEYLVTKLAKAVNAKYVYTLGDPDPDDSNPYGSVKFKDVTPSLNYSVIRQLQRRVGRLFEYAQWEDVDWREFGNPDVLVTSGATTRAVITPDNMLHINYCHSPPRWFYDLYHNRKRSLIGVLARPLIRYLRMRDMTLDPRVDYYFVNSPIIERRLWKFYKRESEALYPPIELDKYRNEANKDYYLHLGRLDNEKGILPIIEAFDGFNERLVMAGGRGDVPDGIIQRIKQAKNIDYLGFVAESKKRNLLANCTAVVFNGRNEDFGIVPVEANASGKPVLARDEGFPGIYIHDGKNGYLHDGTAEGIRDTVKQLKGWTASSFDVDRFSENNFNKKLRESLKTAYRAEIEVSV
jgi:glycosyltransferase involved in cell wall biosynthesis